MTRTRHILHRAGWVGLLAALLFAAAGSAGELPAAEERQIEALIARVAGMTDDAFIRNDRSYDAATAAEFLRRKWRRHAAEVRSAEDFIDRVATGSSTTGAPYRIRLGDGRELPCATVLREELLRLRKSGG
jgi:Family of unknown function (DUF5329)